MREGAEGGGRAEGRAGAHRAVRVRLLRGRGLRPLLPLVQGAGLTAPKAPDPAAAEAGSLKRKSARSFAIYELSKVTKRSLGRLHHNVTYLR